MSKENSQIQAILKSECSSEEQLKKLLGFMRSALDQPQSPRLKDFWEAKTACLQLFKQRISAVARNYFWNEFVALADEARHVKETLDEQSAFASEQIDLAIDALAKDIDRYETLFEKIHPPAVPDLLSHRLDFYQYHQRHLTLLTSLASQLNCLKQEVIKTHMRVRQKARMLTKLQELREKMYPRRQEHLDAVSAAFIEDVKAFVEAERAHFSKPFYALREEIKIFQDLSKNFIISTDAFTKVRETLSAFWDEIRALDKERKKGLGQKKQQQKQNKDQAVEKISKIKADSLDVEAQITQMYVYLRTLDLHRDDVIYLKELLKKIPLPKKGRNEKAPSFKTPPKTAKIPPVVEQFDEAELEAKQKTLLSSEEILVRDLQALLQERSVQRERVKEAIEKLRKQAASSSLDLETSFALDEQMRAVKEQLQSIDASIDQLRQLLPTE